MKNEKRTILLQNGSLRLHDRSGKAAEDRAHSTLLQKSTCLRIADKTYNWHPIDFVEGIFTYIYIYEVYTVVCIVLF